MTTPHLNTVVQNEADDIRSLMSHLDTGSFSYVDITLIEAWQQALKQWPLLAEWDTWSKENNS